MRKIQMDQWDCSHDKAPYESNKKMKVKDFSSLFFNLFEILQAVRT